ncbi:MAG: TolC family protein [Comamonadaceae bacterium]|nr:MAG: TolC family protein [Comamonadaceae bacterium]
MYPQIPSKARLAHLPRLMAAAGFACAGLALAGPAAGPASSGGAGVALKSTYALLSVPAPATADVLVRVLAKPDAAPVSQAIRTPVPAGTLCPRPASARDPSAPSTLQAIVERARQENPDIARAQSQIRKARADVDTAGAAYSPTIRVGASSGRQEGIGTNGLANVANAQLSKLLHDFGKTDNLIEEARRREEARIQEQQDTIDRITLDITETWLNVARQSETVRLHEEAVTALEEAVRVLRLRASAGLVGTGDVELALARLAQVRAAGISACAQREQLRSRLSLLSGGPTGDPVLITPDDFQEEPASPWDASMLPAVRQAEAEHQAAMYHEKSVRASRWPSVYLQATHNTRGNSGQNGSSTALNVTLSMDVLDAATPFRADSANADVQAALLRIESTRQTAEDSLRRTRIDLLGLETRRPLLVAQARSTAATRRSFMDQFLAGRRQVLDLLNTHQEVLAAEVALASLRYDRMVLVARLLGLHGELTAKLSTPTPSPAVPGATSVPSHTTTAMTAAAAAPQNGTN